MNFKFVTAGQSLADINPLDQILTGQSLKPLAPANVQGARDAAGNLTIIWTRKSRLVAGLNPNTGPPVGEEEERYLVEIYSGSTLLRSHYVFNDVEPATDVQWSAAGTSSAEITITTNTVLFPNGDGQALANVPLLDDFKVDFTVNSDGFNSPQYFGVTDRLASPLKAVPPYFMGRDITTSPTATIWIEGRSSSAFSTVAGDKLSIIARKGIVSYYKNYINEFSSALYTSALPSIGPHVVIAYDSLGVASKINSVTQQTTHRSSFNYTTSMQTVDFGSVQSSIKVRVYQISSIVGKGAYTEKTL